MSNPKNQTPTQATSKTSSTPEKPSKPAPKTKDPMAEVAAMLESLKPMLASAGSGAAFRATDPDAGDDDIRIRWQVEIIRGKDTPFGKVSGISAFPGLVSPNQLHLSAEKAGEEMISKVALPVISKFQDLINEAAIATPVPAALPAAETQPRPAALPVGNNEDIAFEAELISQQSDEPG